MLRVKKEKKVFQQFEYMDLNLAQLRMYSGVITDQNTKPNY